MMSKLLIQEKDQCHRETSVHTKAKVPQFCARVEDAKTQQNGEYIRQRESYAIASLDGLDDISRRYMSQTQQTTCRKTKSKKV